MKNLLIQKIPQQRSSKKEEPKQPDEMGISEKAKRQASDESEVARGKG
ncbi:MAG: hypothetical protein WD431_00060 [Cyclobacteriaceae bacterium]